MKEEEPKSNSIPDDRLKDLISQVLKIGGEYTIKDILEALGSIKENEGNEDLSLFLGTPEANGRIVDLINRTNFTRIDNYTIGWRGFVDQPRVSSRRNFLRGVLLGAIGGAVGGIEGSQHNIKKATLQIKELLNQPDLMDFDESRPLAKFANDSLESDLDKMDKIRSKSREYLDMGNKEKALPLLYEALLIARSQRSMIEGLRLTTDRFDKGINNLLWLIHNEEWICWNELKYAGFVVSPGLEPPLLPEGVRKALGMKER